MKGRFGIAKSPLTLLVLTLINRIEYFQLSFAGKSLRPSIEESEIQRLAGLTLTFAILDENIYANSQFWHSFSYLMRSPACSS